MSFDHLWAGWRSSYVTSVSDANAPGAIDTDAADTDAARLAGVREDNVEDGAAACVFCRILESDAADDERHIVRDGTLAVALLNAYPYASGHLLVMPRRHVADLGELRDDESLELWETTRQAVAAVRAAYAPDGCNIGANLGRAAGAGIPRHVHLHVLPRWVGDTNFMTTVAATRVLPEALPESWRKLRAAWPC